MYTATVLSLAGLLLASASQASPIAARTPVDPPFNLTVTSTDGSERYCDTPLVACHSGAAIEALCIPPGGGASQFTFNATLPETTDPGHLVYTLPSQPDPYSQALQLYYQSNTSNVGYAFFGGAGTGPVDLYFHETTNQLGFVANASSIQYVWYVCPQTTLGYDYETLGFVKDFAAPTDADCAQVAVYRHF